MSDKKMSRAEYLIKSSIYYAAIFYLSFLLGKFAVEIADEKGLL